MDGGRCLSVTELREDDVEQRKEKLRVTDRAVFGGRSVGHTVQLKADYRSGDVG